MQSIRSITGMAALHFAVDPTKIREASLWDGQIMTVLHKNFKEPYSLSCFVRPRYFEWLLFIHRIDPRSGWKWSS
jgi:hypothetical protein